MLSENIKTVRKMKGLSQEELAILLSVCRAVSVLLPYPRPKRPFLFLHHGTTGRDT